MQAAADVSAPVPIISHDGAVLKKMNSWTDDPKRLSTTMAPIVIAKEKENANANASANTNTNTNANTSTTNLNANTNTNANTVANMNTNTNIYTNANTTIKEKEKDGSRHSSPKIIRRGRPTDAPPIQQELIDRVKSEPFIKKFGLPQTETLIKDYSAALYKQIPLHGRLYVSQNFICFESKIFNIKTVEVIPFKDISHIRKKSKKMKFSVGIHIDVGAQTVAL
jgi:hypothetical protein